MERITINGEWLFVYESKHEKFSSIPGILPPDEIPYEKWLCVDNNGNVIQSKNDCDIVNKIKSYPVIVYKLNRVANCLKKEYPIIHREKFDYEKIANVDPEELKPLPIPVQWMHPEYISTYLGKFHEEFANMVLRGNPTAFNVIKPDEDSITKIKSHTENGDTFLSIDNTRVSKMLNDLKNNFIFDKSEKAKELFPQWFEPTPIHEYRKYKKRLEEEMGKIVLSGGASSIQDIQLVAESFLHKKMIEESKEPFQILKDAERKKIVFSHFWVKGFGWKDTSYIQDDFDVIKVKYEYSNGESMFLAYDGKELVILKGYYVKD
jgi:hypothetical protein